MEFNPNKRMTVEEALNHPFVQNFKEPEEEKVLDGPVQIRLDENYKLSLEKYRFEIYEDIKNKRREQKELWKKKYLKQLGITV